MTKIKFAAASEGHLDGSLDFDTGTQKMALVRGYTFNAAHRFVSEVTAAGGTLVASVTLTSKTVTGGRAGCANVTFTGVAAGAAIPAVIVYQSSAAAGGADLAASAQRLIGYWDGAENGLGITPNGQPITVAIDPGVNGLYAL